MPHVDELVHDQHDPILVVSLASGDLSATDRDHETAQSLIASCSDCARLHDDVRAIAQATKALPPAARMRDFRLTDADAARLRPAGWRRLLGTIASGPLLSRQLGVGLATLGIAGLLITALPAVPLGMGSAAAPSQPAAAAQAPEYETLQSGGTAAQVYPVPAPGEASVGTDTGGGAASSTRTYFDAASGMRSPAVAGGLRTAAGATAQPFADDPTLHAVAPVTTAPAGDGSSGGPSTIAIVSAVFLVAGLLLLLARRFASGTTPA